MDYRILGSLELFDGSEPLTLTGARQRTLLALLLLERNQVVHSERLIVALWGETAPPSAPKALQNAVVQVRRALGHGAAALCTERGGYVLRVAPGELDADRFESLADAGRAALEAGDAAGAAERLRDALRLWRGPPLADLAYEAFAQPEIARLEEERLGTLEDRIEADLALGRHAALVAELEAEVARQPLRERLRGQLMLALYGSGRQADALEAFHDVRRALLDELGIEPGPALRELHEAILRHDPALGRPARTRTVVASRSRLPLIAAALLLLASAAAAAVLAMRGDDGAAAARIASVPGNSLVAIDPGTARITGIYPAGSTPTSISAGASGTWALNADDGTFTRVAAQSSAPRTLSVQDTPLDLAAGPDGVWALTGTRKRFDPGIVPRRALLLEPASGAILRTEELPEGDDAAWFSLNRIALGRRALWALGAGDRLTRIDPSRASAPRQVPGLAASAVVASGDGAWALTRSTRSYELARISAEARVTARIPVVATELDGLAAGAGAVWVTSPQDGVLWRITSGVTHSIDVGAGARGVAVAGGSVWVANAARGTVTRIDPDTRDITAVIRIGNAPRALASDGKRLWVSVAAAGGGTPARDAARAATGAVTAPACNEVVSGAGTPDRLIVSDLPLHQPGISHLTDAIAFVLRRHDFRAGRFRIGYQSCDDSTAKQGGYDPEKCGANAALYAQAPRVVGIVGPYNSDCALEQLRISNRAPGGPLATISPTNTELHLTKPVPGGESSLPARLYPTGRRHYVRLLGTDDGQGAALARFARERGIERLAIVRDDTDYGRAIAWYARREARTLGIEVLGPYHVRLDRHEDAARALGRRIARERPDGLLHAGVPSWSDFSNEMPGYELVDAVRKRLGRDTLVLGPDSWAVGPEVFAELGPLARGIEATYPGLPLERLGPAGRRFVEEFGATQPGRLVTTDDVYTAQATEVLLDAIDRSDGSRPSVTQALLHTHVHDGLIGDFSFDADGDVQPQTFHVLRLSPKAERVVPGGGKLVVITP
jgi:DNA-binding SARP family transcriptional activator/ABC-type branched-subunit amino acid transport system substrate-binding protein